MNSPNLKKQDEIKFFGIVDRLHNQNNTIQFNLPNTHNISQIANTKPKIGELTMMSKQKLLNLN